MNSTSNFSPPSTTWWLVRIQPLLSKTTPEPTPVAGMTPLLPASVLPVTVIRTTAGLTLAATAMVADDSSTVTGCVDPVVVAWVEAGAGAAGRSRAPAAPRARTVPPEARTAERSAAARTDPPRPPRFDSLVTVAAGTGATRRLVPALRGDRWGVVPDARPAGTRLGSGRVVVGGSQRFDAATVRLDDGRSRIGRSDRRRRLGGVGRAGGGIGRVRGGIGTIGAPDRRTRTPNRWRKGSSESAAGGSAGEKAWRSVRSPGSLASRLGSSCMCRQIPWFGGR